MTRPTFGHWLDAQRHRDDPVGDLARDVAADPEAATATPEALWWHVDASGGIPAALDAVTRAGAEWEAS